MLRASGKAAELRSAGRWAATLGAWKYEGTAQGWTVDAKLIQTDEYWIDSAGPFELRAPVGQGLWRWWTVDIRLAGDRIEVTGAGAPEVL